MPQKQTAGDVIFEGIPTLPAGEGLTSLTDMVAEIILTMKTQHTLLGMPSSGYKVVILRSDCTRAWKEQAEIFKNVAWP